MALQAYWTHGTVCVSGTFHSWVESGGLAFGLPSGNDTGSEGDIVFPLPTPVIVNGNRSRLLRVFVLYELAADTTLETVSVIDGQGQPGVLDPNRTGQHSFNVAASGPANHTGASGLGDLIDNVTRFNFEPEAPLVFFGIAVVMTVKMGRGGMMRITAVGADYDV
jgi:hypothetical protein